MKYLASLTVLIRFSEDSWSWLTFWATL